MSAPPPASDRIGDSTPIGPAAPAAERKRTLFGGRDDLVLLGLLAVVLLVPAWLSEPRRGDPVKVGEAAPAKPLDLNRATAEEWMLLDGVGEARARRILEARGRLGRFHSLDDVERAAGMPRAWAERVRPFVDESSGQAAPPDARG